MFSFTTVIILVDDKFKKYSTRGTRKPLLSSSWKVSITYNL